jgi:hypothetical protein
MTIVEQYIRSLQERPVLTKALTAATLNGLQELIASAAVPSAATDSGSKALKMTLYVVQLYAGILHQRTVGTFTIHGS